MQTMTLKLGDTVISKKTGLPASGVVIGILDAQLYCLLQNVRGRMAWDDIYDGWRNKHVAYVELSSPQKPISFEEFKCAYVDFDIPEEDLAVLYKYNVRPTNLVSYPIDDLEILE